MFRLAILGDGAFEPTDFVTEHEALRAHYTVYCLLQVISNRDILRLEVQQRNVHRESGLCPQSQKLSANGAKYKSQGQATKERRPWDHVSTRVWSPERGVIRAHICRPYRPDGAHFLLPGATRFALAPGFHIPRRWRSVSDF